MKEYANQRAPAAADQATTQRKSSASPFANDSRVTAQRKAMEQIGLSAPVQRVAEEEEEPVQAKRDPVQRMEADEEEEPPIQGRFADAAIRRQAAEDDERVAQAKADETNGGLPAQLRTGIEALSGLDMSGVRVHRNSSQPAQLNALAYAQGKDIHLGPGQEKHLPHEAWHVVQQRQGRVNEIKKIAGVRLNDEVDLEREADLMGERAVLQGAKTGVRNGKPFHVLPSISLHKPMGGLHDALQMKISLSSVAMEKIKKKAEGKSFVSDEVRPAWRKWLEPALQSKLGVIDKLALSNSKGEWSKNHAISFSAIQAMLLGYINEKNGQDIPIDEIWSKNDLPDQRKEMFACWKSLQATVSLSNGKPENLKKIGTQAADLLGWLNSSPSNVRYGNAGVNKKIGKNADFSFIKKGKKYSLDGISRLLAATGKYFPLFSGGGVVTSSSAVKEDNYIVPPDKRTPRTNKTISRLELLSKKQSKEN